MSSTRLRTPIDRALDQMELARRSESLAGHIAAELRPLTPWLLALASLAAQQDAAAYIMQNRMENSK